jgi:hypothetical protein
MSILLKQHNTHVFMRIIALPTYPNTIKGEIGQNMLLQIEELFSISQHEVQVSSKTKKMQLSL